MLETARQRRVDDDALATAARFDACGDRARVPVLQAAPESGVPERREAIVPDMSHIRRSEHVDAPGAGERQDGLLQLAREERDVVCAESIGVVAAQVLASTKPREIVEGNLMVRVSRRLELCARSQEE